MHLSLNMIKLNSTNYTLWKTFVEDILYNKDLYDPTEGDIVRPKDKSYGDWKRENIRQ